MWEWPNEWWDKSTAVLPSAFLLEFLLEKWKNKKNMKLIVWSTDESQIECLLQKQNQKNHKTSHISISFSIIITFDGLILYSLPIKPNFAQTTSSYSDIIIIRVHISCI